MKSPHNLFGDVLVAFLTRHAAQMQVQQQYAHQCEGYQAEIIQIVACGKLAASDITHHGKIYKQQ